jgi:Cu/Zn superoxide dismutase
MNLTRNLALSAAFVAALSLSAMADAPQSLTIKMKALNGSGENGTATLTQQADGLHVVVDLLHAPKDVPQPTHIHIGTCGNINKAPEYPLKNTVNGDATTVVPGVKLSDLMSGHYAVNVHKSTDDLATYVSCGNIK